MKSGMTKGLIAGMMIGSAAATVFGVMNWQTERKWNQKVKRTGSWIADRADDVSRMM